MLVTKYGDEVGIMGPNLIFSSVKKPFFGDREHDNDFEVQTELQAYITRYFNHRVGHSGETAVANPNLEA